MMTEKRTVPIQGQFFLSHSAEYYRILQIITSCYAMVKYGLKGE